MSHLSILLEKKQFRPNESIEFSIEWNLSNVTDQNLEIHLFWHTVGRGTEDLGVYETIAFNAQSSSGKKSFRIKAPAHPYSFSGKLVSLIWKIEVVSPATKLSASEVIQITPSESPIVL